MDPDTMALFRELADRTASEREVYYRKRQVPAALRANVESLLAFDRSSSDSLRQHIAAAAEDALLTRNELAVDDGQSAMPSDSPIVFRGTARFAVQRQLGTGAFGTVYQVWDREQQVAVAIKVLHRWKPDQLFRFKREFRALNDVRHRNLVRLYELFSEADQWFFSMELVDGQSFLEYVRPAGACDVQRLKAALGQLVEGIQALHAARRLHRDLKPANALVTPEGRVVILDFGLVAEQQRDSEPTDQSIVGTAAYMAPEQAASKPLGPEADWYAVGAVLYVWLPYHVLDIY